MSVNTLGSCSSFRKDATPKQIPLKMISIMIFILVYQEAFLHLDLDANLIDGNGAVKLS